MKNLRAWTVLFCLVLPALAVWLCGCDADGEPLVDWNLLGDDDEDTATRSERVESLPELRGTIGEVCAVVSANETPLEADGVVVGLYDKGSSQYPPSLGPDLVKYLKNQLGFGNPLENLGDTSPQEILKSKDTAVVQVAAIIPPGAPKGTAVDVEVRALPRTETQSLVGGYLLPVELQWGRPDRRVRDLKSFAIARGSIFINPFIDPTDLKQAGRLRQGVVLNGGRTIRDMPIRLVLHRPDYAMAKLVQDRINGRFQEGDTRVAVARSPDGIEITIPPSWRDDYGHFVQLLMHLPRYGGASIEAHAHRVAELMKDPRANHAGLALVWEAIGRQILPTVQELYTSDMPAVRYYAARTGLRLGDNRVAGPIITQMAKEAQTVLQLEAIRELGRHPRLYAAREVLEEQLNSQSEIIRIAAYEALARRGGTNLITRYDVAGEFGLDVVQTSGEYVIYATRTGQPRIVIFGRDMSLARPIFFNSKGQEIRIYSKEPLTDPEREAYLSRVPQSRRKEAWQNILDAGERIKARREGSAEDLVNQKYIEIPHDKYEAMYMEHICLMRKLPGGSAYSEPFLLGFGVVPLVRALGGAPRPNPETFKIDGVGLNYGQVVGVLADLCEEGDINAKFVLQAPPTLRRIYEQAPIAGRDE